MCLEKISYLFGGTVDPFSLNALVSCEVYDITLNEWQSIAPYKFPDFTEVQSFYEIRYTYLAEPEVKVLIGIILVWWNITISSQIPGLMLLQCHIMRHTSEDAR